MKGILISLITIISSLSINAQQVIKPYESNMKAVTIRLKPGEDLKQKLEEFAKTNKTKAACIITCVGSLQQASIRFANMPDATSLSGKFEIVSLTGTLAESGLHLHISISDSTGKTIGGHLMANSIVYTTAEIVIGVLSGVEYTREVDSTYGYKELKIKKISKQKE